MLLAACVCAPAAAFAQSANAGPVVDVVEVAGIIDSHVSRYMIERIDEAERAHDALLVFQIDSYGGVKLPAGGIVERMQRATIPIGVFVGPRRAVAGGVALSMCSAASVVA